MRTSLRRGSVEKVRRPAVVVVVAVAVDVVVVADDLLKIFCVPIRWLSQLMIFVLKLGSDSNCNPKRYPVFLIQKIIFFL